MLLPALPLPTARFAPRREVPQFLPERVHPCVKVPNCPQFATMRGDLLPKIGDRICQTLPQILRLADKLDNALSLFIQPGAQAPSCLGQVLRGPLVRPTDLPRHLTHGAIHCPCATRSLNPRISVMARSI